MHATFEATYPRYEFAPLVRLAIAIAGWFAARRHSADDATPAGAAGRAA